MRPESILDTRNRIHNLCWLLADNADACLATPDCCVITTKRLKILPRKPPFARSCLNARSASAAKWLSLRLHFITRMPEPAAKSP